MFSNINKLRILISRVFYNNSKFLNYMFKYIIVKNISYISIAYLISKFIDKLFFFLIISNNRLFFFLNKLFFNNNRY